MRKVIPLASLVAIVAAGAWFVVQRSRGDLALLTANDDATRTAAADKATATANVDTLTTLFAEGSPEARSALFTAIAARPDDDRLTIIATAVMAALDRLDTTTIDATVTFLDRFSKHDATTAQRLIHTALKGSPIAKEFACRVAGRPAFGMSAEVVAMVTDESPSVRKAAILAIGTDREAVNEETLFRLLSDRDDDVKMAAGATLSARGLDEPQIELGRKLLHPEAAVRLSLLGDLLRNDGTVSDLGPWLMRLSRDANPAVRAGAARLAFEGRVRSADWLDDLAERDPDPLVRSVAGHYRSRSNAVRAAGGFAP